MTVESNTTSKTPADANSLLELLEVMRRLRNPATGCPWDIAQNFATIAPYTIEEAYEVADAIERQDYTGLRDELGDLLLQVVFHSQMASEQNLFGFADVAANINAKMIRRHPHVFGTADMRDSAMQTEAWETQKQAEREASSAAGRGALAGLSRNLPALTLAYKTGKRAARVGFDWSSAGPVFDKVREELNELEAACAAAANSPAGSSPGDNPQIQEELGDLLLAVTSLARHVEVDPEQALREADAKFTRRFQAVEAGIEAARLTWQDCTAEELDRRWQEVKAAESSA
jgi:ATP diphosphatase